MAGPVVAAAVFIPQDFLEIASDGVLSGLNDSKQLTAPQRDHFFDVLHAHTQIVIGTGISSVEEIDSINILNATHLAMRRALETCNPPPDHVLVDGRPVPGLPCPSTAIVKGDSKSLLIAAASVIAKVTRDRIMLDLDREFPSYGFAAHKGYGTPAHLAAIREYGPTIHHRRSFRPIREPFLPGLNEA